MTVKHKRILAGTIIVLAAALSIWACFSYSDLFGVTVKGGGGGNSGEAVDDSGSQEVAVDPGLTYQTMRGFGASDCWMGNHVGKYWGEAEKSLMAQWYFSQEFDEAGSPLGAGLSNWRFNLGAGTEEQGDGSDIGQNSVLTSVYYRRAESFLIDSDPSAPESYDWSKAAGQQYFLEKAKEYGCESYVFFSNSPPVYFTTNGKGHNKGGGSTGNANLRTDSYGDFAVYMAEVLKHFEEQDAEKGYETDFTYWISPVNEPQWDWTGTGQEGTPWTNTQIAQLTRELDSAIAERGLSAKIMLPETADYSYITGQNSTRGYQLYQLFNPASANYVGGLPSVAQLIGAHSYWNYSTDANLRATRLAVGNAIAEYPGMEFFQTEWSLLQQSGEGIPAWASTGYLDVALFEAKLMYGDIVYANASSWAFWTAMDMECGSVDRYNLVGLAPGKTDYEPVISLTTSVDSPGAVKAQKTLWALGNYSLFVRPGYRRIDMPGLDNLLGLMGSAYLSPDGSRIVTVFVNMSASEEFKLCPVFLDGREETQIRGFVTDETRDLALDFTRSPGKGRSFTVPPRSIYTVVYDF